ncbi:unnamed protein product [Agarophyton chilense]
MDNQGEPTNLQSDENVQQSQAPDESTYEETQCVQPDTASAAGSLTSNAATHGSTTNTDPLLQNAPETDANPEERPPSQSVQTNARIATVIYDMLIRGSGESAENETYYNELINTFPASAELAREYAIHVAETVFQPLQCARYVQETMRRRSLVLRRVNISSVAMLFGIGSAFVSSLWLWFIMSLAIAATLARALNNEAFTSTVQFFASPFLKRDGLTRLLYEWLFNFMNQENPIVAVRNHGPLAGIRTSFSPNLHITTVFLIPVVIGLVYGVIGALFAISFNIGLNAIGGIRYEAHED